MRLLLLILIVAPILGQEFYNHRERRQTHAQAQQPNYLAYNQAPVQIKQILAAQQARDPIVHLPPHPVPNLAPTKPIQPQYLTQNQAYQYRPHVQIGQAPEQPTYKQIPVRPAVYAPPASAQQSQYAPQYRANYPQPQPQPQPQPHFQPQPRLLPQPQPLPQPRTLPQLKQVPQLQQDTQLNYQYSKNLPPELQQLLLIQQNLSNLIPQGQHRG